MNPTVHMSFSIGLEFSFLNTSARPGMINPRLAKKLIHNRMFPYG